MNFEKTYRYYNDLTNQALEEYLPPAEAYPSLIHQAMRYSVMNGGKRIRPVLMMATAETVGGKAVEVLPAACALEMIHTYSLIHDDLPAMDNDDFRRGKPANHKVYGEAIAVLAGDALLTQAFFLLAGMASHKPSGALQAIGEIAYAAGTFGMIGGQVVDTCPGEAAVNVDTLDYIHRHKTGALYRAAVRVGAILAGAARENVEQLSIYADNLGLAFQIVDDMLDIEGNADKLGKPIGSDLKNQKVTYPSLMGMTASKRQADSVAERAVDSLSAFGREAEFLRQLVARVITRDC